MGSKMLIDAAHPEEVRVVVVRGNKVEEFDYESAARKQLRGNIYLAKVTRVEPSLQAAFVDYGGNRHGFLAFSEIHPDYYQIPVADRKALLEEEAEDESKAEAEEAAQDEARGNGGRRRSRRRARKTERTETDHDVGVSSEAIREGAEAETAEADGPDADDGEAPPRTGDAPDVAALDAPELTAAVSEEVPHDEGAAEQPRSAPESTDLETMDTGFESSQEESRQADADEPSDPEDINGDDLEESGAGENVESVGSEDALEEVPERVQRRRRTYKIQEVIKRRQIILVQVVKEERGNKGAALTTYLSLAGRYTVLMPNTARGGGISRKITTSNDRKRLRKIASDLEVPEGMGLIIRTAGASRTKAEIKRDHEYLLRLWENVRDLTLKSTAPALVYEEGNLIKRSIRDLYNKEIEEVSVAGDDAYREAKDFMRMLMPSHAKNIQPYKEPQPIFVRHQVERQLGAMFSPTVTLPSGGYIVINQTEALVSIDVNSGKATREHSIEDTALKTNLEASEEISRQLRLRDLAGLIVIDFIDMDERRNNRSVERKLKECLRSDRARIQVGRISHFGLLEMSRQRLRTGVLEGSTTSCPHCQGTGVVRSTESLALDVLRTLEDTLITEGALDLTATTSVESALYILNQKRSSLRDIETRYGITIAVVASEHLQGASLTIEKTRASAEAGERSAVVQMESVFQGTQEGSDEADRKPSRRRKRRRRGRSDAADAATDGPDMEDDLEDAEEAAFDGVPANAEISDEGEGERKKPRRRGRRGGRRSRPRSRDGDSEMAAQAETGAQETAGPPDEAAEAASPDVAGQQPEAGGFDAGEETSEAAEREPRRGSRRRSRPAYLASEAAIDVDVGPVEPPAPESVTEPDDNLVDAAAFEAAPGEGNGDARAAAVPEPEAQPSEPEPEPEPSSEAAPSESEQVEVVPETPKPTGLAALRRRGWWQRRA